MSTIYEISLVVFLTSLNSFTGHDNLVFLNFKWGKGEKWEGTMELGLELTVLTSWHNVTDAGIDGSGTCIVGTHTGTDTDHEGTVLMVELVDT